ncbi:MAG: DNA alkylation repair protein [Opitutaceae bacterium]|nr:DNA alkylation repair protein [Opitutaceae bacterium]
MPAESPPPGSAFKHWFDEARYRRIAEQLAEMSPGFDRRRFLALTLAGLAERSLMERLRQTALAYDATLPGSFRDKLDVLRAFAPKVDHAFVAISIGDFVAREGLADAKHSLDALREITRYGSSEFAVRPFLQRDLAGTLAIMETWAHDSDEHVRRLASEGSRPRLPWGLRLTELVKDPRPTSPILETLRCDPSLYVRKSVANHLNDITKDHPETVMDRVDGWDRSIPETAWIVRHALRTLVKHGDPRALALMGVRTDAKVKVARFSVGPRRVKLGGRIKLLAEIVSRSRRPQKVIVDYVVHYVKASGRPLPKVFKWKVVMLRPGEVLVLAKQQEIRDHSTRRHHAGRHDVELQINGIRPARDHFQLIR